MVCSKALIVLFTIAIVQFTAAFSASELHEKLKALDSEKLQKLSEKLTEKLSAHLEKQNAGISVSELHEKIKNDAGLQQKLAEHIKQKSMQKMHEKLKAINPEALEKMKSKLSEHLEKQSAGINAQELHEKIKNNAELQQKLSEHIKEKMSERISKRKSDKQDARAASDCSSSISDIVTQAETLIQDAVKIRSAGVTILEGVAKCAAGSTTAAASCLSGVVTSTESDAQKLVSQIQTSLTKIQTDVGKLASCVPSAG